MADSSKISFTDRAENFFEGLERVLVPISRTVSNTAAIYDQYRNRKKGDTNIQQANVIAEAPKINKYLIALAVAGGIAVVWTIAKRTQ